MRREIIDKCRVMHNANLIIRGYQEITQEMLKIVESRDKFSPLIIDHEN